MLNLYIALLLGFKMIPARAEVKDVDQRNF
jgi:hypothetical protein